MSRDQYIGQVLKWTTFTYLNYDARRVERRTYAEDFLGYVTGDLLWRVLDALDGTAQLTFPKLSWEVLW